jgi:hypothetical protein
MIVINSYLRNYDFKINLILRLKLFFVILQVCCFNHPSWFKFASSKLLGIRFIIYMKIFLKIKRLAEVFNMKPKIFWTNNSSSVPTLSISFCFSIRSLSVFVLFLFLILDVLQLSQLTKMTKWCWINHCLLFLLLYRFI